jgi:hypothetical protein
MEHNFFKYKIPLEHNLIYQLLNTLKYEAYLNYIYKFSLTFQENATRLYYKDKLVNVV